MLCLNDVVFTGDVLNAAAISGSAELTRHIHHQQNKASAEIVLSDYRLCQDKSHTISD